MEGLRQFTDDSFKPQVSLGKKPDEQAVCRLQKFLLTVLQIFSNHSYTKKTATTFISMQ